MYNRAFPRHQSYRDGGQVFILEIFEWWIVSMSESWSAKILVEQTQNEKYSSTLKIRKHLYRKSLNISKDPCRLIFSCPYAAVTRCLQILRKNWLTALYRFSRKLNMGTHCYKKSYKKMFYCRKFRFRVWRGFPKNLTLSQKGCLVSKIGFSIVFSLIKSLSSTQVIRLS